MRASTDASGFLVGLLLMLLFGDKRPGPPGPYIPPPAPLPPSVLPTSTPPWPQVTPSGLPPFPGSGWEYDEPPPAAVQQRASQLRAQLWAGGSGTFKTEQTAGRWVTYRAEIVRSGKQGVVAYRVRGKQLPAGKPPLTASRAPAPAPAATSPRPAPALPSGVTSKSPGLPQAQPTSSAQSVIPASPSQLPVLRYGMGLKPADPVAEVKIAQDLLKKHGALAADELSDGRFGAATRTAVIHFQRQTGLAPNQTDAQLLARSFGVIKAATWAKLLGARA